MTLPNRKRLRLINFDYSQPDYVYFVTIRTDGFYQFFENRDLAEAVLKALKFRTDRGDITLYSFCLMPDHLHLLLSLNETYKKSLQDWVSEFKRFTTVTAKSEFGITHLWQVNFYDHIVRGEESLSTIADYIVSNPVRKSIVDNWTDYKYCGYGF